MVLVYAVIIGFSVSIMGIVILLMTTPYQEPKNMLWGPTGYAPKEKDEKKG